jgi:hypothetical protein
LDLELVRGEVSMCREIEFSPLLTLPLFLSLSPHIHTYTHVSGGECDVM